MGACRADPEREWLPPLFEAREIEGCLDGRRLYRLQSCLREQFPQVAFTGSGKLGLVLRAGIELAGGSPEHGQRRAIAGVVPDARCDDPTGACHSRHLAQSCDGVGHEMDDELCECRVEDAVVEGQAFSGREVHVDCRVARFRRGDERLRWVDRRDCLPADPPNKLARERAGAAAHIQHTLPFADSCEFGQLGCELRRVSTHEPVIGLGGNLEGHRDHRMPKVGIEPTLPERNVWWLSWLSFGESWHNNHHAFPTSAFHGLRRTEIDPGGWLIWLLERAGLAWNVVRIPPDKQARKLAL